MNARELHERASALFLELRALPYLERETRLSTLGDEALTREVRSLLEHDDDEHTRQPAAIDSGDAVPSRIGPYSILRRLGRGGSGYVFLAEQSEPVRRKVAIKVVPHAAMDPAFAARFEFERRALEKTDHPNIAHILDAGRTPDGLPYLVLEYVEGTPITQYCREKSLPLRARVSLIVQIADAVQHAHQRGVIHRDLKPANILVAEVSGKPMPRVLDFGIAKPTDAEGGQATSGMPLGTPAYMAPEQTGGRPVDTRADVYALGAMLYELAGGRPPIDTTGDGVSVLQRIRTAIPDPASRVRASSADLARDRVSKSLLGDLDCVLAKCLEKDPSRRYQTVSAFAADLERLENQAPVEARSTTIAYRATRFVQRNRALAAAIGLGTFAVIAGFAGLSIGLIEANMQRREAANQSEGQREINRFLTEDLLAAASPEAEGDKITALDLLHRASKRVDARFPNRPLIAAAVHHVLGTAYAELGAFDDAENHLNRAIEMRQAAAGPDAPDTVRSEVESAGLLQRRARAKEAEPALVRVIERSRLILGPDDPALYKALNDLGLVYEGLDQAPKAISLVQESLAGRIRLLGPKDPNVLITMSNLAMCFDRAGQTDNALRMHLDALRIADGLVDPPRMLVIGLCNNVGATYLDLNQNKEAEPFLRRASALAAQWLGPEHPDALTLRGNLAGLEVKLGDPLQAAVDYDAVYQARVKLMGPGAYDSIVARFGYWDAVWHAKKFEEAAKGIEELLGQASAGIGDDHWLTVQTRVLLAHAVRDSGHPEQALPHAQKGVDQFTKLYGPEHARTKNAAALLSTIRKQVEGGAAVPRPPG